MWQQNPFLNTKLLLETQEKNPQFPNRYSVLEFILMAQTQTYATTAFENFKIVFKYVW